MVSAMYNSSWEKLYWPSFDEGIFGSPTGREESRARGEEKIETAKPTGVSATPPAAHSQCTGQTRGVGLRFVKGADLEWQMADGRWQIEAPIRRSPVALLTSDFSLLTSHL